MFLGNENNYVAICTSAKSLEFIGFIAVILLDLVLKALTILIIFVLRIVKNVSVVFNLYILSKGIVIL